MADERPFIKSTVQHVGNITDHYLDFAGKSPLSEVNDLLEIMETPYKFFENSFWVKGIYEEAAKRGIGVVLNGGRGNFTISWGPALDYYALLLKRFNWIRFYKEVLLYSKNHGITKKTRMLSIVGKKAFPFINKVFSANVKYEFPTLINPEFAKRTNIFDKIKRYDIHSIGASKPSIYEIRKEHFEKVFFWNTTGTIGTKLSLRYSVWNRDPTNDIRVIKFCLSVPEDQYVQNGLDRALIRRSTENILA